MLSFTTRGEGPRPLVLLHGFLGSARNLGNLARRLVETHPEATVLGVDLPGHGRSPALLPTDDFDSAADAILEVIAGLGKGPAQVIGHSLGGRIGLVALGRGPQWIDRLTLLDIGPSPTTGAASEAVGRILVEAPEHPADRAAAIAHLVGRGLPGALAEWLAMNLESGPSGLSWRIDRAAVLDFHLRTSGRDLWSVAERYAPRIRAIVGGAGSYVTPQDHARMVALGIPVIVLPGAGHFLHAEALESLVRALAAPST